METSEPSLLMAPAEAAQLPPPLPLDPSLSILQAAGYSRAESAETAGVVLLNTCAIRDKAEERVWQRLKALQHQRTESAEGWVEVCVPNGCPCARRAAAAIPSRSLLSLVNFFFCSARREAGMPAVRA